MRLTTIKFVTSVSSDHRGFRRYKRLLLLINHEEISGGKVGENLFFRDIE